MSPIIIGFVGRARSGKDTAAKFVNWSRESYRSVRFAQPLKDACKALYGWCDIAIETQIKDIADERWGVSPRQAMIDMARQTKESFGQDFFVKRLFEEWPGDPIVITDVRYQNEIDAIHQRGGITIKIVRDNSSKFPEEDHIDDIRTTFTIDNNSSINDLALKTLEIINQ
jgi:dephospho-CoA kinase